MQRFSNSMWDEWSMGNPQSAEEAEAEGCGIIASLEPLMCHSGKVSLRSSRLWVFRRLMKIWAMTSWSSSVDIAAMLRIPREMRGKVSVVIPDVLYDKIIDHVKPVISSRYAWSWVRGVWGNSGALYLPKSGYYLLFRSHRKRLIDEVGGALRRNGLEFSYRNKDAFFELILRDQAAIVDFLTRLHLYDSSLALEQRTMVRAMRNRANKLVNCDAANIKKSLEAAQKQIEISRKLKKNGIYDNLSAVLKEMIDLRLEYPSITLTELGELLEKPVSKSTVKYRWRKLQSLAEHYRT